jgi:hypothetical protein
MALKSFLSNLIQGPSPELVCEPYKQKSLVDFKFSVNFMDFSYVKGYEDETDDVSKDESKKQMKKSGNKTFIECQISTTFQKKYFLTFPRFWTANSKEFHSTTSYL